MALTFKAGSGGGDFKSVPPGSHIAICNIVADMGLQPGSKIYPDPKHKVYIRFEVPAERVEYERDGTKINGPIVIGQAFTASMHEKATLRKYLEGWRGRKFSDDEAEKFDVSAILGKPCMLNVIENVVEGKIYSNINSISPLPKGVPAPMAENDLVYYAEEDTSKFGLLPEWLKEKINTQLTRRPEPNRNIHNEDITDEDIPF